MLPHLREVLHFEEKERRMIEEKENGWVDLYNSNMVSKRLEYLNRERLRKELEMEDSKADPPNS
jgi:hypothetical protein